MTWSEAHFIEPPVGKDAWIRWEGTFTLESEQPLTLMSRATDGLGEVQPEWFSLPQPDGGTGWHAISVHGTA